MYYQKLSKFQIAEQQLFQAIDLYLAGEDLVSATTLAGAAEEILGKVLQERGVKNALEEKVDGLCKLFQFVYKKPADPKDFVNLRNNARNEFKHKGIDDFIELDLEQEAVNLLERAIDNYKKIKLRPFQKRFREFTKERVRRYRELTGMNE